MERTLIRCMTSEIHDPNESRFINLIHSKISVFPAHRLKFLRTFSSAILNSWPVDAEIEELFKRTIQTLNDAEYLKLSKEFEISPSFQLQIQAMRLSLAENPTVEALKSVIREFERKVKF